MLSNIAYLRLVRLSITYHYLEKRACHKSKSKQNLLMTFLS